jgi:putative spermidine/putrescine transport system substrate-binding protein
MRILNAVLLAAAMLASASAALAQERFDGVTLRVATYGGGWDKAVHEGAGKMFEALGGKVEYVVGTPANHLAKLIAARGGTVPFDVFDVADSTLSDTIEGGFLEKIDLNAMPNLKDLMPSQYNELAVAGWGTQEGILYDTERFKALGLPAPTHYRDLLDPKLQGRVQPIDLGTPGAVQFIVAAAKDAGGDEARLEPGFELLKNLKATKYQKVGSEAMLNLKNGDFYVVTMHAGFAVQGKRNGMPLGFAHPIVGTHKGIVKEGLLGIAKGAPNKRAAEFFINAYLAEESQYHLAKVRGIIPVNGKARVRLGDDPLLKEFFMLSDAEVANMMRVDWSKIDLTTFGDKWNRAIAR